MRIGVPDLSPRRSIRRGRENRRCRRTRVRLLTSVLWDGQSVVAVLDALGFDAATRAAGESAFGIALDSRDLRIPVSSRLCSA